MYEKITLPNGVRILLERIPYVRSAAAGIWVASGSRYEFPQESGASHFIEHMVFKGTDKYSASDIAVIMDSIGGQSNAYTTRESTCFYGRFLDIHLRTALEVLTDMFFNSLFREEDVISERGVIEEEIDMYEDAPEDLVIENLFSSVFKGGSLHRPILGTKKSLAPMTGRMLKNYMAKNYTPANTIVAVCGNFSDGDVEFIKEKFSGMVPMPDPIMRRSHYRPAFITKRKRIEQNHLCIAFPSCGVLSEDQYAMQLMINILGGGMSSRLFQTVREQMGLCYNIYAFSSAYRGAGLAGIYTALGRDMELKALPVIRDTLCRFLDEGPTQEELEHTREQTKANILMGLESTISRMNSLVHGEMYFGRVLTPDELIDKYNAITREDVLSTARKYLDFNDLSFSAVGKPRSIDVYRKILNGNS